MVLVFFFVLFWGIVVVVVLRHDLMQPQLASNSLRNLRLGCELLIPLSPSPTCQDYSQEPPYSGLWNSGESNPGPRVH